MTDKPGESQAEDTKETHFMGLINTDGQIVMSNFDIDGPKRTFTTKPVPSHSFPGTVWLLHTLVVHGYTRSCQVERCDGLETPAELTASSRGQN